MECERSDEALMLAYKDGDAGAFEQLYACWRGRLYRYLLHQCQDRALADELYQEVWLKVVDARLRYEVTAKFSTWLFRIAHNRLVDHWRASGRRAKVMESDAGSDDEDGDPPADRMETAAPAHERPERWLERRDLAERLAAAIAALPEAQREAFLLAEEGDMTLEEIAAATGTGRETVKSRLRYALTRLRAELEEWR